MNNGRSYALKHEIEHITIHDVIQLLLKHYIIARQSFLLKIRNSKNPHINGLTINYSVKNILISFVLIFKICSATIFFRYFTTENFMCNHLYERRARRFLWLIYTRYRVAVYSVFRSTTCRYKRRQSFLAASLVHPDVSLRVITMVCGLSSWLQVQYYFHNNTYPHPHPRVFLLFHVTYIEKKFLD